MRRRPFGDRGVVVCPTGSHAFGKARGACVHESRCRAMWCDMIMHRRALSWSSRFGLGIRQHGSAMRSASLTINLHRCVVFSHECRAKPISLDPPAQRLAKRANDAMQQPAAFTALYFFEFRTAGTRTTRMTTHTRIGSSTTSPRSQ